MNRWFLVLLVVIVGCVSYWSRTGGPYQARDRRYTVELPENWMQFTQTQDRSLLITRDGVLLQSITIRNFASEKPLTHTKKKIRSDMLSQELAEVIIDDFESDNAVGRFEVQELTPADIGGHPGFRILFSLQTVDGLKQRSVCYGFMADDRVYLIRYTAASRHYFAIDLDTFEQVVKSFKLLQT